MDKFEQMMHSMSQMIEEERIETIKRYKGFCVCPGCPTYNKCAEEEGELLYCLLDASPKCITEEAGCICPACPITEKMSLTHEYFCIKGKEKEQRRM